MTDSSSMTAASFACGQAPPFGTLAGASHEVIKVLLPAAERWLQRLGQEGPKLRRVFPMAPITASPETKTSQPVLLSSGDPDLPIVDGEAN